MERLDTGDGEAQAVQNDDPQNILRSYLEAVHARDLERCMEFFAEDATLTFVNSPYTGRSQIEQWHKDRFAAEFQVLRVDAVTASEDGPVTVDGVITSKKLQTWKIDSLSGRATFRLERGKITSLAFNMRPYNPFEGW